MLIKPGIDEWNRRLHATDEIDSSFKHKLFKSRLYKQKYFIHNIHTYSIYNIHNYSTYKYIGGHLH